MEIVDSQIHQPHPVNDWPADMDQAGRDALSVELALAAMDAAGVDAAVISAPARFADLAVKLHPRQFASVITFRPEDPGVVDEVANIRRRGASTFSPGRLGIRLVFSSPLTGEELEKLRAGAYEPILAAAEKNQVPTCIFLSGDLQEAGPIAKAHPDLVMIIDHFGLKAPPIMRYDNPPFRQLDLLLQLAQFPNVSVKFSGAPALSCEPYPFADLWPSLHKIVNAFGPERLMWGTDFTRCKGLHSYAEGVNYLRYTTELSEKDKELIFGVTLRHIMRWPRPQ